MKPILEKDGKTFSAEFCVQDRKWLKAVHTLATTCAKLEISGAVKVAEGIADMLIACGYDGDLETGETMETEA